MRVAILGTGGLGRGYAAYLHASGHSPVLWSPTGSGLSASTTSLTSTGVVEGAFPVRVAARCAEAVDGAGAILVAVRGNGHRAVMEALAPHVQRDQVVIVSAQLSLSGLFLAKELAARGVKTPIAAWATTAVTARASGPASVHVSGIRKRLEVATIPNCDTQHGMEVCRHLFGDRFHPSPDLLAITLSNLNPPVHMANALCNFTRIEKGEDWANYGGITPAVARLIEALDAERLALAASFGLTVRTVRDHFAHSFGVPLAPLADMAAAVFVQRPGLLGPQSIDTRYVTEDVPFGLLPLTVLGRSAGVEMPLHNAGIALFSALYGRDFRADNDILPALRLEELDAEAIHELACNGWPT